MTGLQFLHLFSQTTRKIFVLFQYIMPQQVISRLMGKLADANYPWLKNWLIRRFLNCYPIRMQEALIEDPMAYPTFNRFFIRELKPGARPITSDPQGIAAPADGTIAQIGYIEKNLLLQAKNHYFDLETLLAHDKTLAQTFYDGAFATLYLAPHNYHRVHMPITGQLEKMIYVPGRLFSVNRMSAKIIPHLYSRNERLICVFNSEAGKIAIILVGAMIVGSIKTVWLHEPLRSNKVITKTFTDGMTLAKGAELGYFKMGSTVIVLCEKNKVVWTPLYKIHSLIEYGQMLGKFLSSD